MREVTKAEFERLQEIRLAAYGVFNHVIRYGASDGMKHYYVEITPEVGSQPCPPS